jgi:DNA invertase Pin-like site-specific DNA recombinase
VGNKNSGRKPNQERRQQIATLREQGATMEEIGRRLGVTRQAVWEMLRRVREAGIPRGNGRASPAETIQPGPRPCLRGK